jgi:hypothetical protein
LLLATFSVCIVHNPATLAHPPKSHPRPRAQTLSLQQQIEVVSIRQKQMFLELEMIDFADERKERQR